MSVSFTLLAVFYLASGVFIFLLGLTFLRSAQSSAPVRATAILLFFAGVGPILSATSIILQSTLREDVVVYRSMVENFEYLWEFYFPALLLFSLTYPRQHRFSPSFVILALIVFSPYIVHLVTIMAGTGFSKTFADLSGGLSADRELSLGQRTIPLGGIGNVLSTMVNTLVKLHKELFLLVNIVYALVAVLLLGRSQRYQINPRVVGQLRTVMIGISVSLAAYVAAKVVSPTVADSENLTLALINFSLVAGGGSVAYAVIKQQFLGIKYIARRAALYGAAAILFAAVYLVVVKPVSDFFGQYSVVSKDAFETGFIILAIIAFQPVLFRTEELLEQFLLRGRDDLQTKFKNLGSEISNVTTENELEGVLRSGFREILDASAVTLHIEPSERRFQRLEPVLQSIGEPVTRDEFITLGEKGQLPGDDTTRRGRRLGMFSRKPSKKGSAIARSLSGPDEVLVPILREKKFVGYFALGEKTYGLRYAAEELALLSVISNQIGVALDNIRLLRENVEKKLIEEELHIARRVQSQLLPSTAPDLDGYQLSASTVPSRQVGGDFYDFELVDDDSLVLVVADVSGKGIPASLLMATLHAAVNSNEDARREPAAMLRRINHLLFQRTSPEEFATVFYGVVDLGTGVMRYASAGHEFPYLVTGGELRRLAESGIVLGCIDDFPYEENTCLIPTGGSLILFTDGVTDAETAGGESFGASRLEETLRGNGGTPSNDLCASILGRVQDFSRGGDYQDDLTLVVLRRA